MRRWNDGASSIPSSCETVLRSYPQHVGEQLVANLRQWLMTGAAGFSGFNPFEARPTRGSEIVVEDFSIRCRSNVRLLGDTPTHSPDDGLTEVLPWYLSRYRESLTEAGLNCSRGARA